MFNQNSHVSKLRKIAIGNFLWMMGLMLCAQAFLQVKNPNISSGLVSFEWWKTLQSLTSLSESEFSFFMAAVVFSTSALVHLGYLIVQLFRFSNSVQKSTQGDFNEQA
jgi:hypothetical protein